MSNIMAGSMILVINKLSYLPRLMERFEVNCLEVRNVLNQLTDDFSSLALTIFVPCEQRLYFTKSEDNSNFGSTSRNQKTRVILALLHEIKRQE